MGRYGIRLIDSPVFKWMEKRPDWVNYNEIIQGIKGEAGYSKHHITRVLRKMVEKGLLERKVLENRSTQYRITRTIHASERIRVVVVKTPELYKVSFDPARFWEMAQDFDIPQYLKQAGLSEEQFKERLHSKTPQYLLNRLWARVTLNEVLPLLSFISALTWMIRAISPNLEAFDQKETQKILGGIEAVVEKWQLTHIIMETAHEIVKDMDKIITLGEAYDTGKIKITSFGEPLE